LVFVDDKLLEWVDEQVDSGKYLSRSRAIEYALAEFKEGRKGGSGVLRRDLPSHMTETNNLQQAASGRSFDESRTWEIAREVWTEQIRKYLREKYGENVEDWKTALNDMLMSKYLTPIKSEAVQTVLKELERKETLF